MYQHDGLETRRSSAAKLRLDAGHGPAASTGRLRALPTRRTTHDSGQFSLPHFLRIPSGTPIYLEPVR